jgi:hypothetical protein
MPLEGVVDEVADVGARSLDRGGEQLVLSAREVVGEDSFGHAGAGADQAGGGGVGSSVSHRVDGAADDLGSSVVPTAISRVSSFVRCHLRHPRLTVPRQKYTMTPVRVIRRGGF